MDTTRYQPADLTGAVLCPCGALATVRDLCSACWSKRGLELPAEAIADTLPVSLGRYGGGFPKRRRRIDVRAALREVRSLLGWFAVLFVAIVALYVFVGGIKGFVTGAAESARYLAGGRAR